MENRDQPWVDIYLHIVGWVSKLCSMVTIILILFSMKARHLYSQFPILDSRIHVWSTITEGGSALVVNSNIVFDYNATVAGICQKCISMRYTKNE